MEYAVEMLNIMKTFPGIVANDNVTLLVKPGEIHALLGENSSGKSTLINILTGLIRPDAGTIKINGEETSISNAAEASALGIGAVYQELKLVDTFSVLENVYLGAEETKMGFLRTKTTKRKLNELIEKYGLELDSEEYVRNLSFEKRQRVAILKALYRGSDIFVFDKPTDMLTPSEAGVLMKTFKKLSAEGKSVILVSDNIDEIKSVADTCTVMRKGKSSDPVKVSDYTSAQLFEMANGQPPYVINKNNPAPKEEAFVELKNVSFGMLEGVNLKVNKGEIVGVAVAKGNGQRELVKILSGQEKPSLGEIFINGGQAARNGVRYFASLGIAVIHEDRMRDALLPQYDATTNLALVNYYKEPYQRHGLINTEEQKKYAETIISKYDISVANVATTPVKDMTGGNQQKIMVSGKLDSEFDMLAAVRPAVGLDAASTQMVYDRLVQLRDSGKAIMLISCDVSELLTLCDRIYVLSRGKITEAPDVRTLNAKVLGDYMSSINREDT